MDWINFCVLSLTYLCPWAIYIYIIRKGLIRTTRIIEAEVYKAIEKISNSPAEKEFIGDKEHLEELNRCLCNLVDIVRDIDSRIKELEERSGNIGASDELD